MTNAADLTPFAPERPRLAWLRSGGSKSEGSGRCPFQILRLPRLLSIGDGRCRRGRTLPLRWRHGGLRARGRSLRAARWLLGLLGSFCPGRAGWWAGGFTPIGQCPFGGLLGAGARGLCRARYGRISRASFHFSIATTSSDCLQGWDDVSADLIAW